MRPFEVNNWLQGAKNTWCGHIRRFPAPAKVSFSVFLGLFFVIFILRWEFTDGGAEIHQKLNSRAGLGVGDAVFGDVRFEGTFFVNDQGDDDCVGILFGYQDHKNFYVVTSAKQNSNQVDTYQYIYIFQYIFLHLRVIGLWGESNLQLAIHLRSSR